MKNVTNVHFIGNKNEIYVIWRNHNGLTISLMGSLIDREKKKNKILFLYDWNTLTKLCNLVSWIHWQAIFV